LTRSGHRIAVAVGLLCHVVMPARDKTPDDELPFAIHYTPERGRTE